MLQRCLKLLDVGGKFLVQVVLVAEIHHENLVIGIAGFHEIYSRLVDFLALFSHRAGVVNHDAHCDRDVLLAERADLLRLAVLKNRKVPLTEVRDQPVPFVHDGRVQSYFLGRGMENKHSIIVRRRSLRGLGRALLPRSPSLRWRGLLTLGRVHRRLGRRRALRWSVLWRSSLPWRLALTLRRIWLCTRRGGLLGLS